MTKFASIGFAAAAILTTISGSALAQGVSIGTNARGAAHGFVGSPGANSGVSGSSSIGGNVAAPGAGVGIHDRTSGSGTVGFGGGQTGGQVGGRAGGSSHLGTGYRIVR